ncbi:MAG: 50S ribosomal protein L32 [Planctomycetota bacterium]
MAVPKRRKSHSKTRMGRAHKAIKPVKVVSCPNCSSSMLPHRVCPNCGFYQGRVYIPAEES